MEAIRGKEASDYLNYGNRETNVIEVKKIIKGEMWDDTSSLHTILFLLEGNADLAIGHLEQKEIRKGFLAFAQSGDRLNLFAKTNMVLIAIRTLTLTELCECLKLGDYYHTAEENVLDVDEINLSVILPSIWHYLRGVFTAIGDGIKSRVYFEAKTRELFLLMRTYYSKQELSRIFLPALSNDIAFSDAVKTSWFKYKTIEDLAEAMSFTPSSFSRHFQKTFGCTAQQWITEQKKILIYKDLLDNETNFKELADKYWFSSVTSFYNWCVKTYGSTPGDMRKKLL
jgi:AraC-like DNA-binding protein